MSYYAQRDFNWRVARLLSVLVVIVWAWAISGCAANPPKEFCSIYKPITVCLPPGCKGSPDQLSDETAKEILANNETWAKLCK